MEGLKDTPNTLFAFRRANPSLENAKDALVLTRASSKSSVNPKFFLYSIYTPILYHHASPNALVLEAIETRLSEESQYLQSLFFRFPVDGRKLRNHGSD
jgi:hypothetical protein